ncbi:hypothetical protein CLAVI_000585 [Candidatus Clavichlamydia salmonicola]|uniref:hypothetical protein n=1 Tax=Candidatus Clavichlamydia salmonicola TaxID=469812 RepID=UPI0018910551|nr:hypothetical protein [Candidatus Clavichlamydia salmonicola]MBF5050962.1 hypothetical protein [Candidatus Clavichlamydia salmonicola]
MCLIQQLKRVCLGGGVYGLCSTIKFLVSVANNGIMPCIKRRAANLDEDQLDRHITLSIEDIFFYFLPGAVVGFMGIDYSCLLVVKSISGTPGQWVLMNNIFGGISCGLYVLDAWLAMGYGCFRY